MSSNIYKLSENVREKPNSFFLCAELLVVNMKIGENKYAMDMLKYAEDSIKDEVDRFVKELEEIIENNLDINKQMIEKADIIIHKIRMDK